MPTFADLFFGEQQKWLADLPISCGNAARWLGYALSVTGGLRHRADEPTGALDSPLSQETKAIMDSSLRTQPAIVAETKTSRPNPHKKPLPVLQ